MAKVVSGRFGGMFGSNDNGSSSKSPLARTPADTTLTPINDLKDGKNNPKAGGKTSLLGHLKNAAEDVGNAVVHGGEAVVKPVADVVTGNEGKAAHDAAQLSSDVTGGALNTFARGIKNVPKAIAGEIASSSSDPNLRAEGIKEVAAAQKDAYGTTDSGKIAKKIVGSTVGTMLLVPGGGAAAGLKAAGEQGAKELAITAAKDAAIGAGGAVAGTETQNPDASLKEVAKNAAIGGIVGGAAPIASSKLRGLFPKAGESKVIPPVDEAGIPSKATSALHIPGKNIYAEITPEQQAHLSDEVNNIPWSQTDKPHLTPVTSLENAGVKKVSLDELMKESPNAKTAIDNVPTRPDAKLQAAIEDAHNSGDKVKEAELVAQLKDPAMDPNHTMTPEEKQALMDKVRGNVKELPADIKNAGAGETGTGSILSQVPKAAVGDTKAPSMNRKFVIDQYQRLIKPVQDAAKGMSEADVKKLESIELSGNADPQAAVEHLNRIASTADNPEQFHKVVQAMREGYNARLASDQTLGRDVGVRNNYLPHLFDTTDENTASKLDALGQKKTQIIAGSGTPGYVKPRTVDTYAEADQLGLKRRNANVLDDYYQSMNAAGYEHGKQALIKGLNDAHPGQIQIGKVGRGTDGQNYSELQIPGARGVTVPEDLADQYNKRAQPKESTGFFGKYDKANGILKYTKLGGGLFHAFTTTGTTLGHQITSLNLLKHPIDNLRVVAGTLSKTAHEANWNKLAADGADHADGLSTVDRMNLAGVTTKPGEILGDANVSAVERMKNSKLNFIKGIHDMVFQRQIPEAKALIFKQATQHLDVNNPADLAKMRNVASAVNNLGGINRAVEGLTPKTAKQLSRVVLATDFTEGKFRTIYNGLTKFGASSPQGKIARQMIVGKSLVFAVPGMAALVASGKVDPSDPKQVGDAFMSQILNPQLPTSWRTKPSKSNPNGTPISLKLPSSFISEIGKVIAPALDPLNPDKTSGIKDYASARLAALPSVGEQVGTNRDYFGNPIYGKDKNGNPISAKQTAENIGNQVLPIPAVQGMKTGQGQAVGEGIANIAGFRATSDPSSAEAAHSKRITEFYNTYNSASDARKKVVKNMNTLVEQGNNAQAARLAQEYNATIDERTKPFRSKYADNYNPAFDQQFISLKIPTTTRAFTSREKAIKESQAVLQ